MASLQSLSSLLGQTSIEDHEQVLKAANVALNKSGKDIEAQHVKLVALLKLDRFDEALRTLEHGGEPLKARARLEWAYALYKAGQPGKAAEVARAVGGDASDRGMRHVEAQASYRDGDFERAASLFAQLAAGGAHVDNEDMDLRINNSAVKAQLEWSGHGHVVKDKKPANQDLEAFETAYNAACASIARDELGQADILLRRSKDLCGALEDLSDEEKEAEILPITVQQIYLLVRQGRLEEAGNLASSIDAEKITESSTHYIAQINATAASSEPANPYLTHRLIYRSPESIKPDRPFGYQSAAMHRNNYALDLLSQKYTGIIASTTSIISKQSSPTLDANINSLSAFNAAAHARNQAGKDAIKAILPVLEKRPTDIGLILVVVQLYVVNGNYGAAITLLESLYSRLSQSSDASNLDARFAPGLVGTIVSLYSARGQTGRARSELAKAAKYWLQRSKDSSSTIPERALVHLYKSAGTSLLDSHDSEDQTLATDIFSHLHSRDKEDRYTDVGLIAALASSQPASITESQLASLTSVERLVAGLDVSALEEAGVAKPPVSGASTSTKRPASDPAGSGAPKKAKKLRKTKMPKDFDPNKKMDAERWLPIKDRSYYRPKGGKKNKAKQAMLTQGGVVADDSRESTRPGTPAAEVVKAQGQPKKNNKKKGKGGKW